MYASVYTQPYTVLVHVPYPYIYVGQAMSPTHMLASADT